MLKPENRLKKIRDFNLLFTHGRWARGVFFDLRYLDLAKISQFFPKNEEPQKFAGQLKIAFAVGLKLSKKAVKRNRLRRLMREAVRLAVKNSGVKPGHYLLFSARPGSLDITQDEAVRETMALLKKASLLA